MKTIPSADSLGYTLGSSYSTPALEIVELDFMRRPIPGETCAVRISRGALYEAAMVMPDGDLRPLYWAYTGNALRLPAAWSDFFKGWADERFCDAVSTPSVCFCRFANPILTA